MSSTIDGCVAFKRFAKFKVVPPAYESKDLLMSQREWGFEPPKPPPSGYATANPTPNPGCADVKDMPLDHFKHCLMLTITSV